MHMSGRDHRALGRGRRPAFRPPAGRRNAIAKGAAHHEDEIDRRHDDEGLPDPDRGIGLEGIHQQVGKRSADHRAAAEAHDRHAGRHAAPVGKPFDQRRDRRDVAEAETDAADDAGAEPHQPELMGHDADGSKHDAAAPAAGGNDACLARTRPLEPAAPNGGGRAKQDEEQRIDPAEVGNTPVAGGGEQRRGERQIGASGRGGDPERLGKRQPEDAETICHADAEMDGERGRRDQPPVETGSCDDPFTFEQARACHRSVCTCFRCSHEQLLLVSDLAVIGALPTFQERKGRCNTLNFRLVYI